MALVDEIYEALLDEEAMAALPARLAAAVGARSSTFQIYEGQSPVYLASSYFSAEMTEFYMENDIVSLDCWTPLVTDRSLFDRAVDADLFMSRDQFRNTAFHNEFFRKFGDDTGYSLGAVLRTRTGMVGLGLHHALGAGSYGEGAIETLNGALPHLKRLAEARAVLSLSDARTRDAEVLLHAQATAILLVDHVGRIAFANRAAERILAASDGLSSRNGFLRSAGALGSRLEAAIARAAGREGSGDAIVLPRPSGEASYRLLIARHRGPGARSGRAMVLVEDPAREDPGLAARLRLLFGLSGTEAELAARLFAGETLAEASDARGVLVSTSRTQLNVILAKTDLRRQSELMAMIGRLPRAVHATKAIP